MKHLLMCAVAAGILLSGCSPTVELSKTTQTVSVDTDFRAKGIIAGSLPEVIEALNSGEISSQALVTLYLKRIEKIDKNGPMLQSILALNPDAMANAKKLDQLRAAGEILGPLHGVPVLLKDNIESKDPIATTAGALALKNNITGRA